MTATLPEGLDHDAVRAALEAAADAAAVKTLSGFRTALAVDNKLESGFDPVTAADRDAEIAIREVLSNRFPDFGIIGEEWDAKASSGAYDWIVDPIDGTRAYISGVPVWGTLIGLMHKGRAIAGMMAQPFTGESWIGIGGETLFRRGSTRESVRVSTVTDLAKAKMSATSPDLFTGSGTTDVFARLREATLLCRWGLDCYAYCLLASGHFDLVVEPGLKDVDIAPLVPVIENAGGLVTTWTGDPPELGGNIIAAATPELHQAAMAILNS